MSNREIVRGKYQNLFSVANSPYLREEIPLLTIAEVILDLKSSIQSDNEDLLVAIDELTTEIRAVRIQLAEITGVLR